MRVAVVADVHLANHKYRGGPLHAGINTRARMILDSLRAACAIATDEDCGAFVIAGDLFDTVRPEPQLIAAVGGALRALPTDCCIYVMRGNHDAASDTPGDHALAPLSYFDDCFVIDAPIATVDDELWLVPYTSGVTSEWLPGVLATLSVNYFSSRPRTLILHAGIADENTAFFLKGAHDSIGKDALFALMKKHHVCQVVAGNWHSFKSWCGHAYGFGNIIQCGALVPTGFDNPGLEGYGSVIIVNTDDGSWSRKEVPGPRFLTVQGDMARETYLEAAEKLPPGMLFVRWKAPAAQVAACAAQMALDELEYGLAGVEAVPESLSVEAAVQAATQAVQASAGNWEQALREYVDAMTLDQATDRGHVFERARVYLTK